MISRKAAGSVALPSSHAYRIMETDNVAGDIQALIDRRENAHINAVIFLIAEEYRDLNRMLSILPFTDILYQLVVFGDDEFLKEVGIESIREIAEFRKTPVSAVEFDFIVRKSLAVLNEIYLNRWLQESYFSKLIDLRKDQEDLIRIGRALSIEKDPEKLLRLILQLSKRITGADAGSIFLVEEDEEGRKRLRFKYSHTYSREIPLEDFVLPMDKKSIAGYVAVTGEVLNIPDVYHIPPDAPYSYNSSFDEKNNYRCISMLVVPMKNHVDQVIGVIQLINSKEGSMQGQGADEAFTVKLEKPEDFERCVVPFNQKYDSLMEAVAGQAAITIENNRLIAQIQNQFEEFVKASVTAIESRDPATSGHSFRVAEICKAMARAVNEVADGYLGTISFTETQIKELELAALLHDFGKVYIDLSVFTKAKKLYPKDYENLILRLEYLYRFIELQYSLRESELLKHSAKEDNLAARVARLAEEKRECLEKVMSIRNRLARLNEPSVTDGDPEEIVRGIVEDIRHLECVTVEGEPMCIISPIDIMNLSIRRGSLNPLERKEIESHVIHTYTFVSKIPWPPEYRNIPEIALRHHEKLNGSGYPDGIRGREATLIQSRIMAIADIYDALVAGDRPYKKALPLDRALAIIREEAEREALDPDLVNLFIEREIYRIVDKDSFKDTAESHEEAAS